MCQDLLIDIEEGEVEAEEVVDAALTVAATEQSLAASPAPGDPEALRRPQQGHQDSTEEPGVRGCFTYVPGAGR